MVNCYASVVYLAFFDKGEAQLSYRAHLNAVGLQAGTPTLTPTLALALTLTLTLALTMRVKSTKSRGASRRLAR